MDNPGFFSLGDFAITAAGTYKPDAGEELTGLAGMTSATVQIAWSYGTGSGSPHGTVYLQTSLDQANEGGAAQGSWIDIAAFAFADASETWTINLSARTPVTSPHTPGDATLSADSTVDGILGDRLRLKTITLGTFANSAISGSAVVR